MSLQKIKQYGTDRYLCTINPYPASSNWHCLPLCLRRRIRPSKSPYPEMWLSCSKKAQNLLSGKNHISGWLHCNKEKNYPHDLNLSHNFMLPIICGSRTNTACVYFIRLWYFWEPELWMMFTPYVYMLSRIWNFCWLNNVVHISFFRLSSRMSNSILILRWE